MNNIKVNFKIIMLIAAFGMGFCLFNPVYAEVTVDTENVTCNGKADGKATINVTGITGKFKYAITGRGFQSSNTFKDLAKGSYTATVRDEDTKCESTKSFTIDEPSPLEVGISGGGPINYRVCDGKPTITLTASASGGTPPYQYEWQTKQVSSDGTYSCKVTDKNGCKGSGSVLVKYIEIVCSKDPNIIVGPTGAGPEKWIARSNALPYTIKFENDPDFATAPAQVVRINQPLDSHTNIYSLRLGNFGFGSFIFEVPENKTYYSKRLDVTDSLGVLVDVTAGIDVTKNEVFWVFKSIDPVTGLAPSNATLGFLLINDSITHKGEGFVSYTIKPKANTITGDSINAQANIVFDINESILTNKIFNTLDAVAPNSSVDTVPAVIDSAYAFRISATDENGKGSGVATYDLFISENKAPFVALAVDIPSDSAYTFSGREGSEYCLFSVAKDYSGNIEATKTTGDVCFSVSRQALVKILQPSGNENYCAGSLLPIKWQSTGIDLLNLYYSENGTTYKTIANGINAGDSIFSWSIPRNIAEGNGYKILITDASDSSFKDETPNSFTINKAAQPEIIASKGNGLCGGDSIILKVNSSYASYRWSTMATTSSITVSAEGWYFVEVTDERGCMAKDSIEVIVYPAPGVPPVTASGPLSFCDGGEVVLSALDGFSHYLWSNGDTTQSIHVKTSGDFTVKVINENGCARISNPVKVEVFPSIADPSITASGALSFCAGGEVILSAPEGFTVYSWSNGDTTRSTHITGSGDYTLKVFNENGCERISSDTVKVEVFPAFPPPAIETSGPLSFCQGGSVVLSAPSGFASYIWSNGATTQSTVIQSAGSYTVKVTNENGCQRASSDTVKVDVSPGLPAPVITASGPLSFCQGGSVVLSAPSGFASYLWSNGATTPSITVNSTGSFSVKVKNASGCESINSDTTKVEVLPGGLPAPVIAASGPLSFCQGGSVVLSAPSGFASYLWSNGATTPDISVNYTGSFIVKVKNAAGCESVYSDTTKVEVLPGGLPAPVITALGPLSFCQGGSVVLLAPSGFASYLWSDGATTPSITVNSTGIFSVKVKNASGCESLPSASVNINVLPPLPAPVITASGPLTFCHGGSVVLYAPSGFASYLWSNGSTAPSITVNSTGSFSVKVKNASGCESPSSALAKVNVLPPLAMPVITASGPLSLCPGGSVVLSASPGFASYLWSNGATAQAIIVNSSGSFSVKVKNTIGCESPSSATVNVNVLPPVEAPVITASGPLSFCQGGSVVLSAPSGFTSYLWSNNAVTPSITVSSTGIFSVKVKNANGCQSPSSATVQVKVNIMPAKPAISVTSSPDFCNGSSVKLKAPDGFTGYLWSNGATGSSIVVDASGTFTVKVYNNPGCASPPSDPVSVSEFDPFTFDLGNALTVYSGYTPQACANLSVQTMTGGTAPFRYKWNTNQTTAAINVCPTVKTTYSLTITDANNCSFTDYINVCVTDVRCGTGNNKVSVCHKTGNESSVTLCLAPSAVQQHLDHGDYLGSCDANLPCSNPDANAFVFDESQELKEGIFSFLVSPNPFSDNSYITLRMLEDTYARVDILNMSGERVRSIFEGEMKGRVMNEFEFKAERLINGVYFCRVRTMKGAFYRKLILIR